MKPSAPRISGTRRKSKAGSRKSSVRNRPQDPGAGTWAVRTSGSKSCVEHVSASASASRTKGSASTWGQIAQDEAEERNSSMISDSGRGPRRGDSRSAPPPQVTLGQPAGGLHGATFRSFMSSIARRLRNRAPACVGLQAAFQVTDDRDEQRASRPNNVARRALAVERLTRLLPG